MPRKHDSEEDGLGRHDSSVASAIPTTISGRRELAEFETPWDKRDLAKFYGTSVAGIDGMIKRGEQPPGFKVGKLWRWRPSVVKAHVAAQEAEQARQSKQPGPDEAAS